jgi:thaumatin family protein
MRFGILVSHRARSRATCRSRWSPGKPWSLAGPTSGRAAFGRVRSAPATRGKLKCAQTGNDTLAEFTLTAGMNSDWYDISLVDGFTIPTGIIQLDAPWTPSASYVPGGPLGADQQCGSPICAVDLNLMCPDSQQMKDGTGKVVGCKNGQSSNGGRGSTPVTTYMKDGCPTSYTYPYDDPQSLFICPSAVQNGGKGSKDYKIIYCPTQGATPGFP